MKLNLAGKVSVVTGGGGAICGSIASAFATEDLCVAIWDISGEAAESKAGELRKSGYRAVSVECDATKRDDVQVALEKTLSEFGTIDVLVNGAGGSRAESTTSDEVAFFDLDAGEMNKTMDLNYLSVVVPSQSVGRVFAEKDTGVIINITSIAGMLPLSRAVSYSNGKAASNSFTRWLAVHMARNYSPRIRVNAIAPGFVLTEQNKFLLNDPKTGRLTERAKTILGLVPMARFGEPREICGTALFLASDASSFVTGAVIPVDGGFSADPGV